MKKKFLFIQDSGHIGQSFVVCAGYEEKEIRKFVKKEFTKEYYDEFCDVTEDIYRAGTEHYTGLVYYSHSKKPFLLHLKEVKDDWEFWETLLHEIVHIVDCYSSRLGFMEEMESRAYLASYLFKHIRRKIQGLEKI